VSTVVSAVVRSQHPADAAAQSCHTKHAEKRVLREIADIPEILVFHLSTDPRDTQRNMLETVYVLERSEAKPLARLPVCKQQDCYLLVCKRILPKRL
jgi:hypothetical protein